MELERVLLQADEMVLFGAARSTAYRAGRADKPELKVEVTRLSQLPWFELSVAASAISPQYLVEPVLCRTRLGAPLATANPAADLAACEIAIIDLGAAPPMVRYAGLSIRFLAAGQSSTGARRQADHLLYLLWASSQAAALSLNSIQNCVAQASRGPASHGAIEHPIKLLPRPLLRQLNEAVRHCQREPDLVLGFYVTASDRHPLAPAEARLIERHLLAALSDDSNVSGNQSYSEVV